MAKTIQSAQEFNRGKFLAFILVSLLVMFISGVAMTAIGQPTTTHILSHSGTIFWHILLGIHLTFLAIMTISALIVSLKALHETRSIRVRTSAGILAILFGIVSGSLVLHKIHPGIFLFCMALSFVCIGAIYGPLGARRGHNDK